jgi:hypothetical protein
MTVKVGNFGDTNTTPFVLVAAILIPLILLPLAKQLGARVPATAPEA